MMCGFSRMKYLGAVLAARPVRMSVWPETQRTCLGHKRNGDVELTKLIQEQLPFLYESVIKNITSEIVYVDEIVGKK